MLLHNKLYIDDIKKILVKDFAKFKNKTFFITGASGLVGSCLVDILMYLNIFEDYKINIYATFTSENSARERFINYLDNGYFNVVLQDINNPINLDIDVDYIVHTASNTHPHLYATKPVETIKLNVLGTLNLLDFAKKYPTSKSLFLSTLEVYGKKEQVEAFAEGDIGFVDFMLPRACYPESKRTCETLCHSYVQEYGLDINIARLGYIYGPTVKLSSSKADVQFLKNALNNQDIIMKSAGMQKRSYCYVLDTVSALLTILLNGKADETYNVATKSGNILLRDYATEVARIAKVEIKYENPSDAEKLGYSTVANSTLNGEKLEGLGWKSQFEFGEAVEHTYKIIKEVKCLKV